MEINTKKLHTLLSILEVNLWPDEDKTLEKFVEIKDLSLRDVEDVYRYLSYKILNVKYTALIAKIFDYNSLAYIVTCLIRLDATSLEYPRQCFAISILIKTCPDLKNIAIHLFDKNFAPFEKMNIETPPPPKKCKNSVEMLSDLETVKCCYNLLVIDPTFFKGYWNWSIFVRNYMHKGDGLQKLYTNHIVKILNNMSQHQLEQLNSGISDELLVEFREESISNLYIRDDIKKRQIIERILKLDVSNKMIINIENVFLPIFNYNNFVNFGDKENGIVLVTSTKINLRSIAMGIASSKAVCLSGPVGCGKTSLVEYIAGKTGRILGKCNESKRRKKRQFEYQKFVESETPANGFLRIQLGDQTDSKMLLGQFRCTDVPGEFIWLPGVLTQAVKNGYWLLLEDIDLAGQDVITILRSLFENHYLTVPGYRDRIEVHSAFQLFFTVRDVKYKNKKSFYLLLERYIYSVNILPLSRNELITIVQTNYPKLFTAGEKIVDIYLMFSSGKHSDCGIDKESQLFERQNIGTQTEQYRSFSTRTVSTRDLMKLCKRCSPIFSSTSTESSYLVFQNAVDVFCSYVPQSPQKVKLVNGIGSKVNITEARCDFFTNEHTPIIEFYEDSIKIGRAEVFFKNKCENKKNKLIQIKKTHDQVSTFSFTKMTTCLLERIGVSISQNEPILLVGETGVGKTTSVQFLAEKTLNKLVVINMNNQSDVSDLIGGFKPVDLSFILEPIRNEFESAFRKTFNENKNENFLNKFSICYSQGNYIVLVKLMLKVVEATIKKGNNNSLLHKNEWLILEQKLKRIYLQLNKSINLSFAFITGSLVNCMKNGDWVLLDEINLASAETLECLSTILEPNGSIVLLERGDFVPIERHSQFRIFACMNPSTDVGKKDLVIGIRNRFTEFFVDEITKENELVYLVSDYLQNTGIEKKKVYIIVQLYKHLKHLTNMELNDGLGNRPVYSLRTLCRALRICAKNLCGSIERNLYESFSLSFLTQLDSKSHSCVSNLIENSLISSKGVLRTPIPMPTPGTFVNFEGYWIQVGSLEIDNYKKYILTDSVRRNLKDLARIISIGKLPILLQGPTSAGKTSLIQYVAKKSGNRCLRINNHEHTDLQEYIGTYTADISGTLSFKEGVLVDAMRNGYWIILDELNLASSDILEALNRVLDDNRELFIPETQTIIRAHPNFMLFATQNPPGLYGGRKVLSRAFKNRFIELHFSEIPREELGFILEKRCDIPESYAKKMVQCMWELQKNRHSVSTKQMFTLRDLFRWGNRYTNANKDLYDINKYDWNQHLVEEGFLVLSAKVRTTTEITSIESTLNKIFKRAVNMEHMFSLYENNSLVTRHIINNIKQYCDNRNDIVWTRNMTTMAVHASKAMEFNEPVLLVGPTGCGKTTVCQILATIHNKQLRILNCHMHTEGSDFLGGLRPCRHNTSNSNSLFEWVDGPLVLSMKEGNYFMADEISLAEDSVLERLNSILEPERTLLISEKGGMTDSDEFIVKANKDFKFLATMNPGGDFGKKELSPALRNRFTEIWCKPSESREDLIKIAKKSLQTNKNKISELDLENISKYLIDIVFFIRDKFENFKFSIRDILSWCSFYNSNAQLPFISVSVFGLQTIFLDSLEMIYCDDIKEKRATIINYAISKARMLEKSEHSNVELFSIEKNKIVSNESTFGIAPFFLHKNAANDKDYNNFLFDAPTTKANIFRLLSALTLKKSILLEGPPGVGKTSVVESLAKAVGYKIVRINLCEHTDLSDLFGTDLPSEEDNYENKESNAKFQWRDGPLLSALKSKDTWILLDELNLAPQSVLEGLNAILDHRGEVYIPELNRTFTLGHNTRIFGCQNPLRQGGGRKGLPQSFLNRFTKVFLKKLTHNDLLFILNGLYSPFFQQIYLKFGINLADKMVEFSEMLEEGISSLEFGYKGGPFEINLRDIIRWCDSLINPSTGFVLTKYLNIEKFNTTLFERMKLVYYQRMRSAEDKKYIIETFSKIFNVDSVELDINSKDVGMYCTNSKLFLNDIVIERNLKQSQLFSKIKNAPLLLSSQREYLKNIAECVYLKMPVLLVGSADTGKTTIIDSFCWLTGQIYNHETIDESVVGGFQQVDLNRHLEDIYNKIDDLKTEVIISQSMKTSDNNIAMVSSIMALWYDLSNIEILTDLKVNSMADECLIFKKKIKKMIDILNCLKNIFPETDISIFLEKLHRLHSLVERTNSINTGGSFEWVESKIVSSLKNGEFIALDHVNFCSSAVLDRLNPAFEPNGSLLISEKGVSKGDECEIIEKHQNFQAFLTIDAKNGELSRAMRNRCIEIALNADNYTTDDLRLMLYANGASDINIVNTLLCIHNEINSLEDVTKFSISSLTKFSYLVSCYMKIGYSSKDAINQAGIEVYIYPNSIDPSGLGIANYHESIKALIMKHSDNLMSTNKKLNLCNMLLNCENANIIELVVCQVEPLKYFDRSINLSSIFSNLENLKWEDKEKMLRYYMLILYEISSLNDVNFRRIYIGKIFPKNDLLLNLNNKLYNVINSFKDEIAEQNLPWNTKMFPNIRDYENSDSITELKISLTLICHLLLNDVEINPGKLSQLSAISYSNAVSTKSISDKLNNTFLQNLFIYMDNLKHVILHAIKMKKLTIKKYFKMYLSFFWFNRLLQCASNKVFSDNKLDEALMNRLVVHFQWMQKHLMVPEFSNINDNMDISYRKLISYSEQVDSYSNKFNKIYVKDILDFNPFYFEEQITFYAICNSFNNLIEIVPSSGEISLQTLNKIISFAERDESKRLRFNIQNAFPDIWIMLLEKTSGLNGKDSLRRPIEDLFEIIIHRKQNITQKNINFLELQSSITSELNNISNNEHIKDTTCSEFHMNINAIRNEFLFKAVVQTFIHPSFKINDEFCKTNCLLDCYDQQLIEIIGTNEYKLFIAIWKELISRIPNEFNSVFSFLGSNYKLFSTFYRKLQNSLNILSNKKTYINNTISSKFELISNKDVFYSGPEFTNRMLSFLVDDYGYSKLIPLKSFCSWKHTISELNEIIWINWGLLNSKINQLNFENSFHQSNKILAEIKYIENKLKFDDQNYDKDFQILVSKLRDCSQRIPKNNTETIFLTGILNSLIGSLELYLSIYLPLIDPAEKHNMKKLYNIENIEHLSYMKKAYEVLRSVMKYKKLGDEVTRNILEQIERLQLRDQKYQRKVACRPQESVYKDMTDEIKHFMLTNGNSKCLISIINMVDQQNNYFDVPSKNMYQLKINSVIERLNMWITNTRRFLFHTLKKYSTYYKDFVEPIEVSLNTIQLGFQSLKYILQQKHNSVIKTSSGSYLNIELKLKDILINLMEFPTTTSINLQDTESVLRIILKSVDCGELVYLNFIKVKIQELKNIIIKSKAIDDVFAELCYVFKMVNKIWKDEEERKIKIKERNESLYTTIVRCTEVSEEMQEELDIREAFPTNIQEDFGEFIEENMSGIISKNERKLESMDEKTSATLDKELSLIAGNFIYMMLNFVDTYYKRNDASSKESIDYVDTMKDKVAIFSKIYTKYKNCIDTDIDEAIYNTFVLMIGTEKAKFDQDNLRSNYNYYKDSNTRELHNCTEIMNIIETKVVSELELYPEHALLNDIIKIIKRIQCLPSDSSLVRFNSGLQILREKISHWNEVAHSRNNLKNEEILVAELITKWNTLELQSWRTCLSQINEKIQAKTSKYWFYIYNLIIEYLENTDDKAKTCLNEIIQTLRQFIESSTFGDFRIRMQLLKSFELFIHQLSVRDTRIQMDLIYGLHNVHVYYDQFSIQIQKINDDIREPIEKRLREFVKIESYNRDLSYFNMKNNISKVHRKLNKFLKEYEISLGTTITQIFQPEDTYINDLIPDSLIIDKISLKNFIIPVEINSKYNFKDQEFKTMLLKRIDNLFVSSRKVVEFIIKSLKYSDYTIAFTKLMNGQMDNYKYLSELKVDRSQAKSKQVAQSRHITAQKRKGLSDFFKMLPEIGLNYKRGLMELSMETELINYSIRPIGLSKLLPSNSISMAENINITYAKCAFRMKLLHHIFLTPLPELGASNIDRIKGFSVDMFLIMQNQRMSLSKSVKSSNDLKNFIDKIEYIVKEDDSCSQKFTESKYKILDVKSFIDKAIPIFEQLITILDLAPHNVKKENSVKLENTLPEKDVKLKCKKILENLAILKEYLENIDMNFPKNLDTKIAIIHKDNILRDITQLVTDYPTLSLLSVLKKIISEQDYSTDLKNTTSELRNLITCIDDKLDDIVSTILLSLQKLYKIINTKLTDESDYNISNIDYLLSNRMHLDLTNEWNILNADVILFKIQNIFNEITNYEGVELKCIIAFAKILPTLKQYYSLLTYYLHQQLSSHHATANSLNVILGAFLTLGKKGFCIPPDLMENEHGNTENSKRGEGFGLEDGSGEKDASDKIESEDQLDTAKKPGDKSTEEEGTCKEEKGIEMSENFDSNKEGLNHPENEDDSGESDIDDELEKEMGETENDNEQLDDQIWGGDEKIESDEEIKKSNEDKGKGFNEEDNNVFEQDNKNIDRHETDSKDALDATKSLEEENSKRSPNDNNDQEATEEQSNLIHNELEEPPEPEEMDLGEDIGLLNEDGNQQDNENESNPFDIDTLKDKMEDTSVNHVDDESDIDGSHEEEESNMEEEPGTGYKEEHTEDCEEIEPPGNEESDPKTSAIDHDVRDELEDSPENESHEYESKEQSNNNQNIQSESHTNLGSSNVELNDEEDKKNNDEKLEQQIDEQDTGQEKDGIGFAENDNSQCGHKGMSSSDKTSKNDENLNNNNKDYQRTSDEQRSLGDTKNEKVRQLKTVANIAENLSENNENDIEADEYQHIKNAEQNHKLTLDHATEEQSKQMLHDNDQERMEKDEVMGDDSLVDDHSESVNTDSKPTEIEAETLKRKEKNNKSSQEQPNEGIMNVSKQVDGETIQSMNVPRNADTTAYCQKHLLIDKNEIEDLNSIKNTNMMKKYMDGLSTIRIIATDNNMSQIWEQICQKMLPSARELCEQLRLILEPTKCSNMKGDYRTGRRLNMKKIIPYIASQFRKDKIWMRRTKPSQRDYKVTIAIDDSKSMCHNNSKDLTLQAISLLYQALSLLESGKLGVVSFGDSPHLILNYSDQFDGLKLVQSLNFAQDKTKIAELLNFVRAINLDSESGMNSFENLLLILSDGQNIYGEGKANVQAAIKLARIQRIFLVYVIIDNPDNKHSILDNQTMEILPEKGVTIKHYLDDFPFPYYVIVRDLKQLPYVLSDAMRQWFELVNSE